MARKGQWPARTWDLSTKVHEGTRSVGLGCEWLLPQGLKAGFIFYKVVPGDESPAYRLHLKLDTAEESWDIEVPVLFVFAGCKECGFGLGGRLLLNDLEPWTL